MEPIRHALIAICLLFLVIVVGTVGFVYLEGLTPSNAIYMTIVTITTVGYGDIIPHTFYGRIFTAGLIISGVGITLYVLIEIMESVLEGRLSKAFGIERVKRGMAKMRNHKIICGGGRTGGVIIDESKILLEELGGMRLARSLTKPTIIDFVESVCPTKTGEVSLESLKIEHGAKIANKRVKELRIKEKIGAIIIAIVRGEKIISNIGPEDEILVGDTVVVIGEKNR